MTEKKKKQREPKNMLWKKCLKANQIKNRKFFQQKKKKKMLMSQNKDMKFFLRERKSSQCHNKDLMVIHTNKLIK